MLARLEEGQQRRGDRRQPRRNDLAARAALDLGDRVFQREMGRRAMGAVDQRLLVAKRPLAPLMGEVRVQHRRATDERRIHKAMRTRARTPHLRQPRRKGLAARGVRRVVLVIRHWLGVPRLYRGGRPIRTKTHHKERRSASLPPRAPGSELPP